MARESRRAEADVQADPHRIHPQPEEGYVGRVTGDDEGYERETGAERRAAVAKKDEDADRASEQSFPASDPPANY